MKKFAKLIALLLALVLVLSLAACKKAEEKSTETAPGSNTESASGQMTEAPAATDGEDEPAATEQDAEPSDNEPATEPAPATESAPATEPAPAPVPAGNDIVGKWSSQIAFADMLGVNAEDADEETTETYKALFGDSTIVLYLEFTADGKALFSLDPDSMQAMFKNMVNNIDVLIPQFAEANGMTTEELEAALAEEGMTMDQFKESLAEQLMQADFMDEMEDTSAAGTYLLDGDTLYIADEGKEIDEDHYMVIDLTADKLIIKEVVGVSEMDEDMDLEALEQILPWEFTRVN